MVKDSPGSQYFLFLDRAGGAMHSKVSRETYGVAPRSFSGMFHVKPSGGLRANKSCCKPSRLIVNREACVVECYYRVFY